MAYSIPLLLLFFQFLIFKCSSIANNFVPRTNGYRSSFIRDSRLKYGNLNQLRRYRDAPLFSETTESSSSEVMDMAKKIKLLRSSTGRGAQDCFKAINEANGDVRLASQILLNSLKDKRSNTESSESDLVIMLEGTIAISCSPKVCSIIDMRCDSDFVAKNKVFTNLAKSFANASMTWKHESLSSNSQKSFDQLKNEILNKKCLRCGKTLSETGTMVQSSLRESISVARIGFIESDPDSLFVFYVHSTLDPKNSRSFSGSSASIVSVGLDNPQPDSFYTLFDEKIEPTEDNCCMSSSGCVYSNLSSITDFHNEQELGGLKKFLRDLAIHVVAEKPKDIDIEKFDKDGLEQFNKEMEALLASGKPKDIAEKILKGKLKKKYADSVLMEQGWTFGDNKSVSQVIESMSKELGTEIKFKKFITYSIKDDLISFKHPQDCSFYNTNIKF